MGGRLVVKLQKLLENMIKKGKTLREIGRGAGVSHSNLSRYLTGSEPDHVNLMKLAAYFNCDFHELLAPVEPGKPLLDFGPTLEDQLAAKEWEDLSPDEKLEAVRLLRGLKAIRGTADLKPPQQ